ncbi:MAG: hypothetical protein ABL931_14715, partial [Usitatibacteraceae bacterium]
MIETKTLRPEGIAKFLAWLENPANSMPPSALIDDDGLTDPYAAGAVDAERTFDSRWDFGAYLNKQLTGVEFTELMSPEADGLWAWLAAVYFQQLTAKGVRRSEHYIVTRKGSAGSLAYRQAARTSFELVHMHGENASICLRGPMHTFGEMAEQLASRQTIAHSGTFFNAAHDLYMRDGILRRGWSSKPKKPKERKS